MARNKRYQYEENIEEDDKFISRTQKKKNSSFLQEMGEEIAQLPAFKLALLPLSDDLIEAIPEYKRIPDKEARRRHLQLLGRLMREAQDESTLNKTPDLVTVYLEMKKNS